MTNNKLIKKEFNGVTFINLTPHEINIVESVEGKEIKEIVSFKPSGKVARVNTKQDKLGEVAGISLSATTYSDVDLGIILCQEHYEGIFIVSAMVLNALKETGNPMREFCVAPDTNNAVRNGMGHIVGVPGFTA